VRKRILGEDLATFGQFQEVGALFRFCLVQLSELARAPLARRKFRNNIDPVIGTPLGGIQITESLRVSTIGTGHQYADKGRYEDYRSDEGSNIEDQLGTAKNNRNLASPEFSYRYTSCPLFGRYEKEQD
jgi:hypothetical protein